MSWRTWRDNLAVNLEGVQKTVDVLSAEGREGGKEEKKPLLREGGCLQLVGSLSGIGGNAGQTNYASAKAALMQMAEALQRRGDAGKMVQWRVNCVAPGFIHTHMTKRVCANKSLSSSSSLQLKP